MATLLLATGVVSVAHLFVIATRANLSAQRQTFASTLAQEKMEQLRGLAWGFDDVGLPISDYDTDLAVDPPDPDAGVGLSPSPGDALAANVNGYVDYLENDMRPRAKASFRLGRDKFEQKLRLEEGIAVPVDRLLSIAMRELQATQDAFKTLAGRMNGSDPLEAWARKKADHPGPGELAQVGRGQLDELATFLRRQALIIAFSDAFVVVGVLLAVAAVALLFARKASAGIGATAAH